ncbi:MAG: hypothetical protein ACREF4_14625, partial [Gammaproteobacteria bacterium]
MAFKEISNGTAGNMVKWQTPGQTVEGRLIGIKNGKVFNGKQTRIAIIEKPDASRVNAPLTTVLESNFAEINPGAVVRVTYLGTVKGQSGDEYKNFKVEVDDGGTSGVSPASPDLTQQLVTTFANAGSAVTAPTVGEYDRLSGLLCQKVGDAAGKAQLAALAQLVPDQATREKALAEQLR